MQTSQGEQKIINILKANRINFMREYSFKDLKSPKGKPMRFDFMIYLNGGRSVIIEYDGEGHFKKIKHFTKTTSDFKYRQECDFVKNQYCLMKHIPLYRIPYYDIDSINKYEDLFKSEYLVRDRYHNYRITNMLNSKNKKIL